MSGGGLSRDLVKNKIYYMPEFVLSLLSLIRNYATFKNRPHGYFMSYNFMQSYIISFRVMTHDILNGPHFHQIKALKNKL